MNSNRQDHLFRQVSLERLSSPEQLDQLMQIASPKRWIPIAAVGVALAAGIGWSILGRIPVTAVGASVLVHPADGSEQLMGLAYFDSRDANQIRVGMPVVLVPDITGGDRIGGVIGRIQDISASSVTTLDQAQNQMSLEGLPQQTVIVLVDLEPDTTTVSGYKWTSASGRDLTIPAGATATARLTLMELAPIQLVFPFLGDRES